MSQLTAPAPAVGNIVTATIGGMTVIGYVTSTIGDGYRICTRPGTYLTVAAVDITDVNGVPVAAPSAVPALPPTVAQLGTTLSVEVSDVRDMLCHCDADRRESFVADGETYAATSVVDFFGDDSTDVGEYAPTVGTAFRDAVAGLRELGLTVGPAITHVCEVHRNLTFVVAAFRDDQGSMVGTLEADTLRGINARG